MNPESSESPADVNDLNPFDPFDGFDPRDERKTVGFLGAGKMARAMAIGIAKANPSFLRTLTATARTANTLTQFFDALGSAGPVSVTPSETNLELVSQSDVVILGIKPAQAAEILPTLRETLAGREEKPLFLSLMAGITTDRIEVLLGEGTRIVRAMPNTPALIGEGITGYAPGRHATEGDLAVAQALLAAVGTAVRVEEPLLDAVTAVSGSGPAYVYHFLNALIAGGIAEGLSPAVAKQLAVQTAIGAAKMVGASDLSPIALADQVKSPGGTTVAGCNVLAEAGWEDSLQKAVAAARRRATEMRGSEESIKSVASTLLIQQRAEPSVHIRRHLLAIRVTTKEKHLMRSFSDAAAKSFSDWARPVLIEAFKEESQLIKLRLQGLSGYEEHLTSSISAFRKYEVSTSNEHVRKHLIAIRVTTVEKEMLQDFAYSKGKAFSDWARPILLAQSTALKIE
ncbi:pyrroline-5-carboxylate reductase [Verrucomicrobium sp. GAS474]|uniref:pyrroline-5-carboxylate reductase n=1 Tax=Verrucomicrobium sp. GAS474 TaxID=1882831 RepID=UPI00087C707A|nr:pyrroline-5-carboxylate reductase [Verrucomicrobium sp. GAS474]SDU19792.1 pyrroline-5-carboxylate reductase [Verrucomicrobium sp. GAS474]